MSKNTKKIVLAGLFIALSFLGTMLNITIPVGASKTMFHFGNVFCLLASLMLGGVWGGTAGAIGMGLFDYVSPGFQLYVPQTLVLKFCIGLICGVMYKKLKIKNNILKIAVSCSAAMLFNIIFSPIASYFTSIYIIGTPKELSTIMASWSAVTTSTNAVVAVVIATAVYAALEKHIKTKILY